MRLLAVPIGLAGVLLLGWALIRAILSLGFHTRVGQVLLALVALCIVVEALEAGWHQLSALQRLKAQASWRWRTQGLLHSTALSLWPVVLALLTSLLGIAEWFTAPTYGDGIECDGWHLLLDWEAAAGDVDVVIGRK